MYISDQLISKNHTISKLADTMLVYEPIFNKYGYTTEDFLYSINKYVQRPDKFAKVFKSVQERMEKEKEIVQKINQDLYTKTNSMISFRDTICDRVKRGDGDNYEKSLYYFFFKPDSFTVIPSEDSLATKPIYNIFYLYDTIPSINLDYNFPYSKNKNDKANIILLNKDESIRRKIPLSDQPEAN